jgi:hypothetical protein
MPATPPPFHPHDRFLQLGRRPWLLGRNCTDFGASFTRISAAVGDADAEGANAGFSLWPGMDAWYRHNGIFPQQLRDKYRDEYVGARYYGGSTPNQRLMGATACYLASEVWGAAAVTARSNAANGYGDPTGNIAAAYGNFTLQQNATSVTLVWTPLTALEKWRYANFGSSANTGRGADDADPNHDGELNLLEFATGQDPHASTRAAIALELAAGGVTSVYTRSKAAVDAGFLFTVEISDTLAPYSWTGLGPGALIADGPLQTLGVPLPWTPRRFARLRIGSP